MFLGIYIFNIFLSIYYIMGLLSNVLSSKFKSKSLIFLILVILVILYVLSIYLTMFEKEITRGQKYVRPAGRYSYYQIVDTEENYSLGDSVFSMKFNSADDYAMIKEGKKYKVHGYWFRLPLMSWFPNIYKHKEV